MAVIVKGFCCMSLRTACLVIAWLAMASTLTTCITGIAHIIKDDGKTLKPGPAFLQLFLGVAFGLCFNGVFMRGIYKKKHIYLLPTLIVAGIGLVLLIFGNLILLISGIMHISKDGSLLVMAVLSLFSTGFGCWVWIVIYSHYEEIRLGNRTVLPMASQAENGQMLNPPIYLQSSK